MNQGTWLEAGLKAVPEDKWRTKFQSFGTEMARLLTSRVRFEYRFTQGEHHKHWIGEV